MIPISKRKQTLASLKDGIWYFEKAINNQKARVRDTNRLLKLQKGHLGDLKKGLRKYRVELRRRTRNGRRYKK